MFLGIPYECTPYLSIFSFLVFFFPPSIRTHFGMLHTVTELIYNNFNSTLTKGFFPTYLDEPFPYLNLNIFISSYVLE